jgi:tetratricopeptide (TPR) repeat protein
MAAEAVGFVRQAAPAGKDDPDVLWTAGQVISYFTGDHAAGQDLIERALTLNANSALAWCARGYVLTFSNQPEPAIESFSYAMRLSPLDPLGYMFKHGLAIAHILAGRFEEAMTWLDQVLHEQPRNPSAIRYKTALCGHLGMAEEGQRCVRELLALFPGATLASFERHYALRSSGYATIMLDGLRKAGLPEE